MIIATGSSMRTGMPIISNLKSIAETGKPVSGFSIERLGDLKTIEMASRKAKEFVHWATELPRVPVNLKDIWVSTKCGESDTTSGLASNPTIGRVFERLEKSGNTLIFGETSEVRPVLRIR